MTRLLWLALALLVFISFANTISASPLKCGECKHGACVDGTCVCKPGFFGPDCASGIGICVEASGEGCVHGTCRDGECICNPGYFGERCENKGCLNNCSFKGLCFEPADEPPKCLCMYGHYGPDCSKSGCSKGCQHGTCLMSINDTIRCQCEPGYTGDDCSIRVCSPCIHGACDGVECKCDLGYTGIDCSKRMCPDCGDRGECDPLTGQCICKIPFFSRPGGQHDCSGNENICPNKCTSFAHGLCMQDGCHCRENWTGTDCSEVRCINDCSGNGQCNKGVCMCEAGFTGPDCSKPLCPNSCSGNGLCVDGQCTCLRPFSASALKALPHVNVTINASVNVTEAVANGAPVNQAHPEGPSVSVAEPPVAVNPHVHKRFYPSLPLKHVEPGFTGSDCSSLQCATDCGENQGQGKCDTRLGVCMCNKGWYWREQGLDCSIKLCDNKCSDNGLCYDNKCHCLDGFLGPNCDQIAQKLDNKTHTSFLQVSSLAQQQAALTSRTERSARVELAKNAIVTALHHADKLEALQAAAAVRKDAQAAMFLETEHDAGIAAAFIDEFGSSSAAFVHVLQTQDGEAAARVALAEIGQGVNGALSPEEISLNRILSDTKQLYAADTHGIKDITAKIKAFNETLGAGCLANCSNRGICQDGACKCHNSFGRFCEQLSCPKGCSGHGVCDSTTGKCACDNRYGGPACSEPSCDPHDCNGHGKCEMVSERNKFGVSLSIRPRCVCNEGWTGVSCDVAICDKKCSNRGTCSKDKCFCAPGFAGEDCEQGPICSSPCRNNGTCTAHYDGANDAVTVACVCKDGWTGPQCDQKQCSAEMETKCGAHGACIADKCVCEAGWQGETCSYRTDCGPCSADGGVCGENEFGQPTCLCNEGFGGPSCSAKVCDKDCNKRGQCLDGLCVCNKGWRGEACDQGCENDCSQRGTCTADSDNNPMCQCPEPFYGKSCQYGRCPGATLLNDGTTAFCSSRGTCDRSTGKCKCDVGYTGEGCNLFNVTVCKSDCKEHCHSGSKGAFPVVDVTTGETVMMTAGQCMIKCLETCK